MRKSLAIIASALLLAVAAATTDRLRYDTTVFADPIVSGGTRAKRVEYPPCIKGVREDRCVQLYERGVRRSYARWLERHGRGEQAAATPVRTYPPCRSRTDDRCQQRATTRQARAVRRARAQQAQRKAVAPRRAQAVRAAQRPATRPARVVRQRQAARPAPIVRQRQAAGPAPVVRQRQAARPAPVVRQREATRPAPVVRQREATRPPAPAPAPRRPTNGGTPGI